MICLCKYCIEEIKSRAEKVYVGSLIDIEEDEEVKCEWCEEESEELYECTMFY